MFSFGTEEHFDFEGKSSLFANPDGHKKGLLLSLVNCIGVLWALSVVFLSVLSLSIVLVSVVSIVLVSVVSVAALSIVSVCQFYPRQLCRCGRALWRQTTSIAWILKWPLNDILRRKRKGSCKIFHLGRETKKIFLSSCSNDCLLF